VPIHHASATPITPLPISTTNISNIDPPQSLYCPLGKLLSRLLRRNDRDNCGVPGKYWTRLLPHVAGALQAFGN